MSGLFSRLAQLHSGSSRSTAVSATHQPLFKNDLPDQQDHVSEPGGSAAMAQTQLLKPITPPSHRSETTSRKEPEVQVDLEAGEETSSSRHTSSAKQIPTEVASEPWSDTTQPLNPPPSPLPRHELSETHFERPVEKNTQAVPPFVALDSAVGPILERPPLESGAKQSQVASAATKPMIPAPQTKVKTPKHEEPRFEKRKTEISREQETTVNVTIGRIEVRANIEGDKPRPKKVRTPNRRPLMSLDEYQAKRQRGER